MAPLSAFIEGYWRRLWGLRPEQALLGLAYLGLRGTWLRPIGIGMASLYVLSSLFVAHRFGAAGHFWFFPAIFAGFFIVRAQEALCAFSRAPVPLWGRRVRRAGPGRPGEAVHDWIRRADDAMYAAKQQGRNRCRAAA